MININIIKSIIEATNNNSNDINSLKQNSFVFNEITTFDSIEKTIFKYKYTDYKLLTINYNILLSDQNNNLGVLESKIIIKKNNNTLVYPNFENYDLAIDLKDCKINLSIDSTYVYINVVGLDNNEIVWKGWFLTMYLI